MAVNVLRTYVGINWMNQVRRRHDAATRKGGLVLCSKRSGRIPCATSDGRAPLRFHPLYGKKKKKEEKKRPGTVEFDSTPSQVRSHATLAGTRRL